MKKKKIILRRTLQMFFIFLFFYFLYKTSLFPIPEKLPLSLFFRIDGLLALFTGIATLNFTRFFLPAFVIMALILMRGNFFCFWICPFGGSVDFCNIILFRKKWKKTVKIPCCLRKVKFYILGITILTAFLAIFVEVPHILWAADPYVIMTRAFIFKSGWLVLFIAIVIASVIMPRLWCNNICPLGCLNNILGVKIRFFIRNKLLLYRTKK
ncbi:MAG TPA: 4Fe-4S binding protein [bacterium]|nr:4Fe-4S binding protein [bacterium]